MSKELETLEFVKTLLEENKKSMEVCLRNNYKCDWLKTKKTQLLNLQQALEQAEQYKALEKELGLSVEEMATILKTIKPNLDSTSIYDVDDNERLHIWQKYGYAEEPLVDTSIEDVEVNNAFKKWLKEDKSE